MRNIKMFDMSSEELCELIDTTKIELVSKNLDYKKLKNDVLEIVTKYPNLDEIYDTTNTLELTKEECKMLQKLIELQLKISEYEEHEMLFLGGRIAYIYFKKIGIIK